MRRSKMYLASFCVFNFNKRNKYSVHQILIEPTSNTCYLIYEIKTSNRGAYNIMVIKDFPFWLINLIDLLNLKQINSQFRGKS